MKKLLLSGLIAFISTFALGQATTKIGTSTNYVEVRNLIQIDGLSNSVGNDSALIIDGTTHHVKQKLFTGGGSYTLPAATTSILGGVKVDGTTITINGSNVISAAPAAITLTGDVTGSGNSTISTTIGANKVLNSMLNTMPTFTIKGNNTGSTGPALDLTTAQARSLLSVNLTNNTSDVNKPVSTLQQAALNLKADLASPTFTGIPLAPTAAPGTNTSQLATTAFVIANSGGGSGYTLPIASFTTLGGVKIGTGLAIDGSGVLSTTGSGVSSFNGRTGAILPQTGDYNFNQIGNLPNTLSGYGIGDAYPLTGNPSNFLTSVPAQTWGSITGKPTTLSGFGITDPIVVTSGTYVNPTWISTLDWAKLINKPSTVSGYNISDAVTLTGVQTLTNKSLTSPTLTGVPTAPTAAPGTNTTQVATTAFVLANGGGGTYTLPAATAGVRGGIRVGTGLNIASDVLSVSYANLTFTGTTTLPLTTNATLLADDEPLFTFGAGGGLAGDTASFSTTAIYGSVYNSGSYSYVITSMNIVLQGSSPSVLVDVLFGGTLNSGGTHLVNAGTTVTNTGAGTNVTVFNNTTIAPGNHIWVKTPTVTTKGTYIQVTLIGHKVRN